MSPPEAALGTTCDGTADVSEEPGRCRCVFVTLLARGLAVVVPGAVVGRAQQRTRGGPSFDHVIRLQEQRPRDRQAEGLRRLEVDDQLELYRRLDGKLVRRRAL